MLRITTTMAAAVMLFAVHTLPAQGTWSQLQSLAHGPSRAYHAAAYDLVRHRLVSFGGFDSGYTALTSTWEYDGMAWTQSAPSVRPSPRGRHAMVYDFGRERVVLFGGAHTVFGNSSLDDTWEYDGSAWVQSHPKVAPPSRLDHAMVYDLIRGRTVLFGGRPGHAAAYGDTWEWDGKTWQSFDTASKILPRYRHAMAYDLMRGRRVLFGGRDATLYDDTWAWDGKTWCELESTVKPPARSGHAMAYDIARHVTVMCGGIPSTVAGGSDTWEWDGQEWREQGAMTSPRTDHILVYDARLQRTTMHGGTDITPVLFRPEVHTYGHTVPGTFESLGSSCTGSTSVPGLFAPVAASGPMMGATSSVHITGIWHHAFFLFGWSDAFYGNTLLPYDLAPYGMPGCSLQVSRDAAVGAMPSNGIATIQLPIPENPFLVGQVFHIQGLVLDPAANVGGFTTTNHLKATIGRF